MSNLSPGGPGGQRGVPLPPRGDTIARYDTYLEAQRAVDFLSDNTFPVQFVTIVGTGLQMVERVTGRLTYPRVALAGAASGAWFGLMFGLVVSLFSGTQGAVLAGPLFGAAFGILYAVISYALTRGRRDFTSASQIVAGEYAVLCLAEHAGAARQLLGRLPGGSGRAPEPVVTSPWQGTPYGSPSGPAPGGSPGPAPYGTPWQGGGEPGTGTAGHGVGGTRPMPVGSAAEPDEPGLTYGEAIERQRRERVERERAEREAR